MAQAYQKKNDYAYQYFACEWNSALQRNPNNHKIHFQAAYSVAEARFVLIMHKRDSEHELSEPSLLQQVTHFNHTGAVLNR